MQRLILFGDRDAEIAKQEGSQSVRSISQISAHSLAEIRQIGAKQAARQCLNQMLNNPIEGFWIHLDADVLNDEIMPAV